MHGEVKSCSIYACKKGYELRGPPGGPAAGIRTPDHPVAASGGHRVAWPVSHYSRALCR